VDAWGMDIAISVADVAQIALDRIAMATATDAEILAWLLRQDP
jgi:hypothetical protein